MENETRTDSGGRVELGVGRCGVEREGGVGGSRVEARTLPFKAKKNSKEDGREGKEGVGERWRRADPAHPVT